MTVLAPLAHARAMPLESSRDRSEHRAPAFDFGTSRPTVGTGLSGSRRILAGRHRVTRRKRRKRQTKCGSGSFDARDLDGAAERGDDLMTDVQAEPSPFARRLGRIERVE